MSEQLNFSLPGREPDTVRSGLKPLTVLMVIVLIGVLANTAILLTQRGGGEKAVPNAALSAEQQKELALKLQNQGLNRSAVSAWKQYLAISNPGADEAARIWYRIGKLYQADKQYESALDAYYRSEGFAKPDDISREIAVKTQECLEKTGRFAALRYELADRVGEAQKTDTGTPEVQKDDPVVAEIGPRKILKSELDRKIEHLVDVQMSTLAAYVSPDQLNREKEKMLKQYSTDHQRLLVLNQYIMEEVLYRKARELKLMDDARVRSELDDLERSLLAEKVVEKELSDNIRITPADLETYYKAHQKEYVRPERAKIAHILVADREGAEEVHKRLNAGQDFAGLAAERSLDVSTRKSGGEISGWIERAGSGPAAFFANSDEALSVIFSTAEGRVAKEDVVSDDGIHIIKVLKREEAQQKTFDEVQKDVFVKLRSAKEREVQQALVARLKKQYDVVIHGSAFSGRK